MKDNTRNIRKGIIAFLVTVLLLSNTLVCAQLTTPISSHNGRIVVLADDWTLGNYWNEGDTLQFTSNVFMWLTEFATPEVQDKILIDKDYYDYTKSGHDISGLLNGLTTLGYNYDLVSPSEWTPEMLSSYGAVLLERGQFTGAYDSTIIKSYILNGGGILVIGGASPQNIVDQNNFLNSFGLQVNDHVTVGIQYLTEFVSHPITENVDSLATLNPTPITLVPEKLEFVQEPQVLSVKLGYYWLAVWDGGIPVTIDLDPDTLNLKSQGEWITAHIELPAGYDINEINISTIRLNGTIPAEPEPKAIGDYDGDSVPDLMVKFDRTCLIDHLDTVDTAKLTELSLIGELFDGTPFEGYDIIRVIDKGK